MRTKLDIYVSVMCSWAPNFMNYANDGCDEHVGDVTVPTQVIEYNQIFLQAE
jgi:hypothetical protein